MLSLLKMVSKLQTLFLLAFCLVQNVRSWPSLASQVCESCQNLETYLYAEIVANDTDTEILKFMESMCVALEAEDTPMCWGVDSIFNASYAYVIRSIAQQHKNAFCGLIIDGCETEYSPANANWSIKLPDNKPIPAALPLPSPNKPKLRVLQLSDLHIDNDYTIGAEVQCTWQLCCRPENDTSEGIARPSTIKEPAGKWGSIGVCDAPYWLFENMLQNIAKNHQDIDYILVTGDLVSHTAHKTYRREGHIQKIHNVSAALKTYFPNKEIYFAIGNHEAVPLDHFAPHFTPQEFHMDWLYDTIAESFYQYVPEEEAQKTWRYRGSYMKKLFPGLRLIVLNSAYSYESNIYMFINGTDPDGSLSWLVAQLTEAESVGDKVHVAAHVPSGSNLLEGWAINYYNIVNRFESTIVAQFFGHEHVEAVNMYYENPNSAKSRPTSVVYLSPSMTTFYTSNPAYRIYTLDGNYTGSTFQVLDFEDHFLNLTIANAKPDDDPVWEPLFMSVKKEYGLANMSAEEWNNAINRMEADNTLLQKYWHNMHRRLNMEDCTGDCVAEVLCFSRKSHNSDALCQSVYNKKNSIMPELTTPLLYSLPNKVQPTAGLLKGIQNYHITMKRRQRLLKTNRVSKK